MRYRWAAVGDVNAFFGLMLDNVVNLVLLAGILIGGFGFPAWIVYERMFPGTALGVLFGDLVYTWLAFRLAAKTGRSDVTAMPLGLDSPSTIGMAYAVLGPAFLAAKASGLDPDAAATHAWKVGMATMVLMGVLKVALSFVGGTIQRWLPSAALLGTLAGIGIALLGALQLGALFREPIVGLAALGVIWYSLASRNRLPLGAPEVLVSALVGTALFYALAAGGWTHEPLAAETVAIRVALPLPSLGFLDGMGEAFTTYLPVAVPFAILTVVGGIDTNESARLAGDEYSTRDILLTEAFATLIAGLFGGVAQTTPYIGHPAYKRMGGRAAYTLATGLFIGLGGILGFLPLVDQLVPEAALVPILLFVAAEILSQAFHAVPVRHATAVAFAMLPNVAQLVKIVIAQAVGAGAVAAAFAPTAETFSMVANGFILTGMLWGAALAFLADGRVAAAVGALLVAAGLSSCGLIHSVDPGGAVYWPWAAPSTLPAEWAAGYGIVAALIVVFHAAGGGTATRTGAPSG